jgi:hypothetical protein
MPPSQEAWESLTRTAANLGRISSRDPRDLAHAVVGLIGENVALVAGALARRDGGRPPLDIVYAGATLRSNPALREVLTTVTSLCGAAAWFLPAASCGRRRGPRLGPPELL